MAVEKPILAWHFCGDTLRDGRPIPADGEVLTHKGEIKMCGAGLHASLRLIDALNYAPGSLICRVECWGDMVDYGDKLVARHRRIIWRVEGDALLRDFARKSALSVIHLWDAPDVARQYLETGDKNLSAAAAAHAWAAGDAARRARVDARDAVDARGVWTATAARDAADAARVAAWTAADARAAAGAARAARAAARAVRAAAGAARDAAKYAAKDAEAAAWDAGDAQLTEAVETAHKAA